MVKTKVPQEKNIQVVVRCRWVAHKDDDRDKFCYVRFSLLSIVRSIEQEKSLSLEYLWF